MNLKQYNLAKQLFLISLKHTVDYNKRSIYFGLARSTQHMKQLGESQFYFRKAIEYNKCMSYHVYYHYGRLLLEMNDLHNAKKQYEICLNCKNNVRNPHANVEIYNDYAYLMKLLKKLKITHM